MDPQNVKMREAMAHVFREAQALSGSGGSSGKTASPPMLATSQGQARRVHKVLAHVPTQEKVKSPSYWPCMELSQERRVSEMEVEYLLLRLLES
jgi:hypothetical protein